jgi:hypothetical protein
MKIPEVKNQIVKNDGQTKQPLVLANQAFLAFDCSTHPETQGRPIGSLDSMNQTCLGLAIKPKLYALNTYSYAISLDMSI